MGAILGVLLGLLINVIFLPPFNATAEDFYPTNPAAKYGYLAAPLTGGLLLAVLCGAFGSTKIRGRSESAMIGLVAGIVIGALVGALVIPRLFCPRPDNPQVRITDTMEWGGLMQLGVLFCVPTGSIIGLIAGLHRGSRAIGDESKSL